MFDSQTKLSTEVVNDLKGFIAEAAGKNLPWSNARIFTTRIRRNIKLAESPSFGQSILQYDSASHGASDYRALAKEVIEMTQPTVVVIAPAISAPMPSPKPVVVVTAPAEILPAVTAPLPSKPAANPKPETRIPNQARIPKPEPKAVTTV
jgi:chromosome partitioning protein